jgi:hypothetical protein
VQEIIVPRQQNDRDSIEHRFPPNGGAERQSIEPRHDDIRQDEIRRRLSGELERLNAITGLDDPRARLTENPHVEPAHVRLIVRHENMTSTEAALG